MPAKTENKDGNLRFCHSRAGGNLEFQCLKNLSEKTKTLSGATESALPSFPRKWESGNQTIPTLVGI
ncbi:hypothetical protein EZZ75_02215 [Neisseria meningitidis]|nr:hypothetical protein [Neisseria meningitidis]